MRTAILALVALFASPTAHADDFFSAANLYEWCREARGSLGRGFCAGFIVGVAEMGKEMHRIDVVPPTFNYALISSWGTCITTPDIDALISAFLAYARDKPEMSRFPARDGVLQALRATWPCSQR